MDMTNREPEVEKLLEEHYKGGSVLDIGCGSYRYKDCFDEDGYVGIDKLHGTPIEDFKAPKKKFDYVFSSVVLEQLKEVPDLKKWGKKLILVEPTRANGWILGENLKHDYLEIFKPKVKIPMHNGATFMVV